MQRHVPPLPLLQLGQQGLQQQEREQGALAATQSPGRTQEEHAAGAAGSKPTPANDSTVAMGRPLVHQQLRSRLQGVIEQLKARRPGPGQQPGRAQQAIGRAGPASLSVPLGLESTETYISEALRGLRTLEPPRFLSSDLLQSTGAGAPGSASASSELAWQGEGARYSGPSQGAEGGTLARNTMASGLSLLGLGGRPPAAEPHVGATAGPTNARLLPSLLASSAALAPSAHPAPVRVGAGPLQGPAGSGDSLQLHWAQPQPQAGIAMLPDHAVQPLGSEQAGARAWQAPVVQPMLASHPPGAVPGLAPLPGGLQNLGEAGPGLQVPRKRPHGLR